MNNQYYTASDERYIERSYNIMVQGYVIGLKSGQLKPLEFDHNVWQAPRTLINYYFRLTPDTEFAPYYSLIEKLNKRSIEVISQYHQPNSSIIRRLENNLQQGNTFTFRPWDTRDLDSYQSLLDNPKIWALLIDDYNGPITKTKANLLLESSNTMPERHDVSAVIWKDNIVGQVRLEFPTNGRKSSAEVSYWLGEPYWGKGLMSEILPIYIQQSFQKYPFESIFAMVLDANAASKRLLEKSGFRLDVPNYKYVVKNGVEMRHVMYRAYRADFIENGSDHITKISA